MSRLVLSAMTVATTLLILNVAAARTATDVPDFVGRSDERGRLQIHAGTLEFSHGSTVFSDCTHALVLDYAFALRAMSAEPALVVLKGRSHHSSRSPMLDSRTLEAILYLVNEKGLDRRFILVQTDRSIIASTDPKLAVSIDVFVVFKGMLPNHDFVVHHGELRPVDSNGVAVRRYTRPTSACSGARAARSLLCP